MSETLLDEIEIYIHHGLITEPGAHTCEFDPLPQDPIDLVSWVQELLVHIFWAEHYGLELNKSRQQEENLPKVERQIECALELCSLPINQPRELEQRLVGNCRDFSTLMTAAASRWDSGPLPVRFCDLFLARQIRRPLGVRVLESNPGTLDYGRLPIGYRAALPTRAQPAPPSKLATVGISFRLDICYTKLAAQELS
jgi:hypothetical protein